MKGKKKNRETTLKASLRGNDAVVPHGEPPAETEWLHRQQWQSDWPAFNLINRRFFFFFLLKVIRFGRGQSIWHVRCQVIRLILGFCLFTIKSDQSRKIKTKGKTQCRQSINMQDGTTQLLYISSYKSDSRHIKAVFRQSGFFPLLSFSFFFSPPPLAMQDRATIMQPWQHPMHTWCRPIYTHRSTRRIEKQMKSYQMFVWLMWWVSRRRPSSVFQAAGWWRRNYVDPRTIELHDGSCVSPRFIISTTLAFKGSGIIYYYLPHSFFFFFFFYGSDYAALPTSGGNMAPWPAALVSLRQGSGAQTG